MKKKYEDPLEELQRIRGEIAKECQYNGRAIGEYLQRIPLLPGQKWYAGPEAPVPAPEKKTAVPGKHRAKAAKGLLKKSRRSPPAPTLGKRAGTKV